VPYFDCYCPIQSLPWAFKTDLNAIPNTIPYLFSDSNVSAQWEKKLFNVRPFKIGIAWSGKREDRNDAHRSIPTTVLSALFELDVDFYCLQIKIDSTDKANALAHKNVHFFESEFKKSSIVVLAANNIAFISTPTSIAGNNPTIEKQENRPPTPFG
jgi:hypothetical protein